MSANIACVSVGQTCGTGRQAGTIIFDGCAFLYMLRDDDDDDADVVDGAAASRRRRQSEQ